MSTAGSCDAMYRQVNSESRVPEISQRVKINILNWVSNPRGQMVGTEGRRQMG